MPFHRGIEGKVKVEEPFYNYSPQILLRIHWRENLPHAKKRQLQARVTTVKKAMILSRTAKCQHPETKILQKNI